MNNFVVTTVVTIGKNIYAKNELQIWGGPEKSKKNKA